MAFPLPDLDFDLTRPFWEAAARGELAIPRCEACAAWVWYPRERCPGCDAPPVWTPVSGRATLFSWTVVHQPLAQGFGELVPYTTGLVALAEDPSVRLATLLVDCDPAALRVDQPVTAVFRPLPLPDGPPAPLFVPA